MNTGTHTAVLLKGTRLIRVVGVSARHVVQIAKLAEGEPAVLLERKFVRFCQSLVYLLQFKAELIEVSYTDGGNHESGQIK